MGGPQIFLGARWIGSFLKRLPDDRARLWALRILSLSPHYFIDADNPKYAHMSTDEYLETSFEEISASRERIFSKIFKSELEKEFAVMDYGSGPGFLAKAVSPHVRQIYAVDISEGAIVCAKILNSAANIDYSVLSDNGNGNRDIPDESVNAAFSFAVVQHLTDEAFGKMLDFCHRKLRPDGKIILHLQLIDDAWKTEASWSKDRSLKGIIKYKYGLHCFGRTEQQHFNALSKHGFHKIETRRLDEFFHAKLEEVASQRILIARKMPS